MKLRNIGIAFVALAGTAALAYVSWPRQSALQDSTPDLASQAPAKFAHQTAAPRVPAAPASATAAARVRRLVATRLGLPRELRFDRVRTVNTERFGALTCGYVAWGDAPGSATEFKRFVATKRSVLIEGRAEVGSAWARTCAAPENRGSASPAKTRT